MGVPSTSTGRMIRAVGIVVVCLALAGCETNGPTTTNGPTGDTSNGPCHPSYSGCLDPSASDYDCRGGTGDGPKHTGYVEVKGSDPYGLDADGDGEGCE